MPRGAAAVFSACCVLQVSPPQLSLAGQQSPGLACWVMDGVHCVLLFRKMDHPEDVHCALRGVEAHQCLLCVALTTRVGRVPRMERAARGCQARAVGPVPAPLGQVNILPGTPTTQSCKAPGTLGRLET